MNKNKTLDGRLKDKLKSVSGSGYFVARTRAGEHSEKKTSPTTLKLRERVYSPPSDRSVTSCDRIIKSAHHLSRRQKRVEKAARQAKRLGRG